MPGPIYIAGRTPLSNITGGTVLAPSLLDPYLPKFSSSIVTQPSVSGGTVTAPSFPVTADLAAGSGTRSFSAVTTQAGDYLLVEIIVETNESTDTFTASSSGLTFTSQNDVMHSSALSHTRIVQTISLDSTGGSRTVQIAQGGPNTLREYRARLTVVRGSSGVGNKAIATAAQTVSLARSGSNSAIFMAVGDWSAGSVGTPTWTPGGSTQASQQTSQGTYIFGRWDSSGATATASHGISSPSYATPSIAVLEMLGTASSGGATVTGSATFTSDSTLTATSSSAVFASANFTVESGLSAIGTGTITGSVSLSAQSNLAGSGANSVIAASPLSGNSTLVATPANNVLATIPLSGQSTFVATAIDSVIGASLLSANFGLTAGAGTVRNGAAAFSVESSVSVSGTITRNGAASFTVQANQSTSASVNVLGSVASSIQSNLNSTAIVTKLPTVPITVQANLNSTGIDTVFGNAPLTVQVNQVAIANITELPSVSLSANFSLAASGVVGSGGISASLTVQVGLTASALINELPGAPLSANFSLAAAGVITRLGAVPLTVQAGMLTTAVDTVFTTPAFTFQANMTATATVGSLPVTATLSAQSNMTVTGSINVIGVAPLTSQVNLAANGRASQFASAPLAATVNVTSPGTVGKLGIVNMSAQSGLTVSGYIAIIYFGSATLTIQSGLIVNANSAPPWTFTLIEFSEVSVNTVEGGRSTYIGSESDGQKVSSIEGRSSTTIRMEGG
jgi:trimeric autotransporter adhesin